ncbi:MAG: hypothetical protein NVS1B14_04770 [Vulcanimicrobiaceae bacterium]
MLNNRGANPGSPRGTTIALAVALLSVAVAAFALLYSLRPHAPVSAPAVPTPSAPAAQAALNNSGINLCQSVVSVLRARGGKMFSDCQFMHLEGSGGGFDITVNVDPAQWRALSAARRAQLLDSAAAVERKAILAQHGNAGASMLQIAAPTGTELARRVLSSGP